MKAITINPFAKTVEEIDLHPVDQEDMIDAICRVIFYKWVKAAMSFPNGDFLYLNSKSGEAANDLAFSIMVNGICVPFLGRGLIVGYDIVNDSEIDTHYTTDLIKPLVRFYDLPASLLIKSSDLTVLNSVK